MVTAQDRTLDQYQELMTINATSHVLRAARQIGLLDQLLRGQQTLDQLAEALDILKSRLELLLRTLTAIGIVEKYHDDFALSATARLLCQYDADLGDATWQALAERMKSKSTSDEIPQERFDSLAATQWVHTPAAMQAAEIVDTVADDGSTRSMLDLGCGSAVWSCAMAHRDPELSITGVDTTAALVAAQSTAASIDLTARFRAVEGSLMDAKLPEQEFDYTLIAQRLHSLSPRQITGVLARMVDATRAGGRVIVIDSFTGPHRPTLAESIEAIRICAETSLGEVPDLRAAETRMRDVGLDKIQFTFIAASRIGLGLMTGTKPIAAESIGTES